MRYVNVCIRSVFAWRVGGTGVGWPGLCVARPRESGPEPAVGQIDISLPRAIVLFGHPLVGHRDRLLPPIDLLVLDHY